MCKVKTFFLIALFSLLFPQVLRAEFDFDKITEDITSCGATKTIDCPSGYKIITGGFDVQSADGCPAGALIKDYRSYPPSNKKWRCKADNHKGTCYAICGKWVD